MRPPPAERPTHPRCLLHAGLLACLATMTTNGAAAPESARQGADLVSSARNVEPGTEAIILPTRIAVRGRAPTGRLARRVRSLDALLADTAQDLGLLVDLTDRPPVAAEERDEHGLAAFAQRSGKLTILPVLRWGRSRAEGPSFELRLIAARPGSRNLIARVERVEPRDLSIRAVVMLRDVVTEAGPQAVELAVEHQPPPPPEPTFSSGRAILAATGTIFGGFMGYSLQRASGSDDPRLLYPLLTVGAGVGLGGAIIVADEWNVEVGDAWYLGAGGLWPAVGAHLIYEGKFADSPTMPEGEQWAFGLVASTVGLGVSAMGLIHRSMGDGGATLAHSGGGAGLVVGALAELAVTGSEEDVPLAGMGYGAMAGWLIGATSAVHIRPPADQVLTIDLGVVLGGLAGASAASPLLFDETSAAEVRGWVAAASGGMLAGGVVAWYLSRDDEATASDRSSGAEGSRLVYRMGIPQPALIGAPVPSTTAAGHADLEAALRRTRWSAAPGLEWHGVLW